jgi:plastocyanin
LFEYLIRRTPVAVVAALAAVTLGAAAPAPSVITIGNLNFEAQVLTVPVRTTVTWVNGDDIPHTVVAVDKSFRSKVLDIDDRFAFTFTKTGTYDNFCSIHPHMTGMRQA